jgi:hypothetical protein
VYSVTPMNTCAHCAGALVLSRVGLVGRVHCVECGCAYRYGERLTLCEFSPTEAVATPSAASANTDVEQ